VDYTSTREGGQYRHRLSPRSYLSDRIVCTMLAEDVRDLLGARECMVHKLELGSYGKLHMSPEPLLSTAC
jgi:hypothetical protein